MEVIKKQFDKKLDFCTHVITDDCVCINSQKLKKTKKKKKRTTNKKK